MVYAKEEKLPNWEKREQTGEVAFDHDMFEHYRKLIHIRNSHPALQLGDYQTLLADDTRDLFAFSRAYQNQEVIVIINNSRNHQYLKLAVPDNGEFDDILNDQQSIFVDSGQLNFEIKPKMGRVFLNVRANPL
jgi:glycosidase